jgi:hypothetical protein
MNSEYSQSTDVKTLVFDVDGTLVSYSGWHGIDVYGEPLQDNIDLVNKLFDSGRYQICIWSSRTNELIQGYPKQELKNRLEQELKKIGVRYHKILDENKPLYFCLIDDRVINLDRILMMRLYNILENEG